MIKIVAPEVFTTVVNRAMQVFGGAGVSDDFPLALCGHMAGLCTLSMVPMSAQAALARTVIRELVQ